MEKLIESFMGVIEVLVCGGLIAWGGHSALKVVHHELKEATIRALKAPSPSLSQFTKKLTDPK